MNFQTTMKNFQSPYTFQRFSTTLFTGGLKAKLREQNKILFFLNEIKQF